MKKLDPTLIEHQVKTNHYRVGIGYRRQHGHFSILRYSATNYRRAAQAAGIFNFPARIENAESCIIIHHPQEYRLRNPHQYFQHNSTLALVGHYQKFTDSHVQLLHIIHRLSSCCAGICPNKSLGWLLTIHKT